MQAQTQKEKKIWTRIIQIGVLLTFSLVAIFFSNFILDSGAQSAQDKVAIGDEYDGGRKDKIDHSIDVTKTKVSNSNDDSQISQIQSKQISLASTVVNGQELNQSTIELLARQYGIRAQPGRYWYDPRSGAFGFEGAGAQGVLMPGLNLGAMSANASGGGDGRHGGVFVNGRELHPNDVAGLQATLGRIIPGRYWFDSDGSFGYENGQYLGNLYQIANQNNKAVSAGPRGSRPSGCYGDSACDTQKTWLGENYFSDGKTGCIVMEGEVSC